MSHHIIAVSRWSALVILLLCALSRSVCAQEWEVINDDQTDDFFAEELFVPVDSKQRSDSKSQPSIQHSKIDLDTSSQNSELPIEIPTLAHISTEQKERSSESLASADHVTQSRDSRLENEANAGAKKEDKDEGVEVFGAENENSSADKDSEAVMSVDSDIKSDSIEGVSSKVVVKNAKPVQQSPRLNKDEMRFQSEKKKGTSKHAGELNLDLSLDPEFPGVEEIFLPGSQTMTSPNVNCPPGSSSWECLMLAEDLHAMSEDRNLSGATSVHRRVKRQTNTAETTEDETVDGSGDGNDLYPLFDLTSPTISLQNSLTFDSNTTTPFDETAFRNELKDKLEALYQNVPGFDKVTIDNVTINPDGTVDTSFKVNINSGAAEFSQLTNDDYLDSLEGELKTVSVSVLNDLDISGRKVVSQTPPEELRNQASTVLSDPCATHVCPLGFHQCSVVGDTREVRCEHKCQTFETTRNCEHGSTCEVDENYEPFCACTKRWTGTYCELPVQDNNLDDGEIAGVALGAGALCVGLVGTACYLLMCRKRNKDIVFSNYSDEEGSDKFSNPSSKLSNFVIDRPRISIAPISTFNPSASLSGLSSSGNSGARANRYSSA